MVSPTINVMCVNLAKDELAPLIYTEWPHAQNETTDIPGQVIGWEGWQGDVPVASDTEWLNATVVDDIFHWGNSFQRRPPVFQMVRFPGVLYVSYRVPEINEFTYLPTYYSTQ